MEKTLKLLLVDDDELDRITVRRALRSAGVDADIDEAADAPRALEMLQQNGYDCIILDYNLPGYSGTKVVQEIRTRASAIPVLILTGQGNEDVAVELMKAGAADYLSKGQLSPERFAQRLFSVIRMQRAENRAQETLRTLAAERELLKGVLEQMLAGVIIAESPTGKLLLSNKQVEEILGHPYHDGSGGPAPYTAYHADGTSYHISEWPLRRSISQHEAVVGEELECVRQDGSRVVLRASSAPVRGSHGEMVAAVMTLHDITPERRNQEMLREETRLIETLQRIGSSLTSQLDRGKLVAEITKEAIQLTGAEFGAFYYTVTGEDGERYVRHLTTAGAPENALPGANPDTNVGITPMLAHAFHSKGVVRLGDIQADPRFAELARQGGSPALRSYMAVPVVSNSGTMIGGLFFGHSRNNAFSERDERIVVGIAGWASVAMDNARLYEEAQRALQARERVLAVVSHDLRNPLNAISIAAEALLDPSFDADLRTRYIKTIQRGVHRSNRLINDLLDVSRIEAGQLSVDTAAQTVQGLLAQAVHDHEMLAGERSIRLRTDIEANIPRVRADRERILQVLGNLISNALRFTETGGTIDLRAVAAKGAVRLSVADTGAGIPAEALPHVFDRYWQARKQGRGGAGLGLAIAKGIVEAHGGTLLVHSKEGVGTEFSFTLPAAD